MTNKLYTNSAYSILIVLFILFLFSCKETTKHTENDNQYSFKVGIKKDPPSLLPLRKRSIESLQITPYVFLQLADFNPKTYKNEPILLTKMPEEIVVDTGEYKGTYKYDIKIKDEAKWDDGSPISAEDYLFTIKLMLNPMLDIHPAIWSMYSNIVGVELDKNDDKSCAVYTKRDYFMTKELVTNLEIYPEYFYDSAKVMRQIDFDLLKNKEEARKKLSETQGATELADKINGVYFTRDNFSGSGPYFVADWEANRYITLKKKNNWWGDNHKNTYLKNKPDEIIFKIIPDKTTSLTELKNGNIDFLKGISGSDFKAIRSDSALSKEFDCFNPLSNRFYSIVLNTSGKILSEREFRVALAHLIDVDYLIKTFGTGGEKRIISPINPNKSYYNKSIKPINFDIGKAKQILEKSGWKDSNGDGILDKKIKGKLTNAVISYKSTSKPIGKAIGLSLKENCKKIGIDIKLNFISSKESRSAAKKADFDIIAKVYSKDLVDYSPYPKWHSDNAVTGGANTSRFNNKECDKVIEQIISEKDKIKKEELYLRFQEILNREMPTVFLFGTTENMVVNSKFEVLTSSKRPGYFANTATLK